MRKRRKPAPRDWKTLPVAGVPFRVHQHIRAEMYAWDSMPADCRKALEMEKYHEPPVAIGMLQAIRTGTDWRLFLPAFRQNSRTLYERDLRNAQRQIKEKEDEAKALDSAALEAAYNQSFDPPRSADDTSLVSTRDPPAKRRSLARDLRGRFLSLLSRRDGS